MNEPADLHADSARRRPSQCSPPDAFERHGLQRLVTALTISRAFAAHNQVPGLQAS